MVAPQTFGEAGACKAILPRFVFLCIKRSNEVGRSLNRCVQLAMHTVSLQETR